MCVCAYLHVPVCVHACMSVVQQCRLLLKNSGFNSPMSSHGIVSILQVLYIKNSCCFLLVFVYIMAG